jgi:hypothetical protein
MIFQIFSSKNYPKNLAFFADATAIFLQKMIITLVFEKNAHFSPKLAKIAEISDRNIDPW